MLQIRGEFVDLFVAGGAEDIGDDTVGLYVKLLLQSLYQLVTTK
jgi:hypothetical protein